MPTDPICKMEVARGEAVTMEYEGRIVSFCSEGCRDVFINGHAGDRQHRSYELIIVGGGPAGLTAAVYAATMKIDAFVLMADLGGQAIDSTKIKNYLGYDFITGPDLSRKFTEQMIHSNYVAHLMVEAEKVTATDGGFAVTVTGGEEFRAGTAIVATGMSRRKLGVPGEEEFQRKGVFYGNIQDFSFVQGRDVAVIGGGNSAMQIAENLATAAHTIHLVSDLPLRTTADTKDVERIVGHRNVRVHEGFKVEAIAGTDVVEAVGIRELAADEGRRLPVRGVFIAVGMRPNSAIVAGLARLNERGEIAINADCATSVPDFSPPAM